MIGDFRVLTIIAARGGSKGLPGKNIRPVGGRPLINWTVEAALAACSVDHVILSTDDDAIAAAASNAGCDVPFRRDAELASDTAASTDVVLDALARVPGYDLFVLLQPTSPLRTAQDIDAAVTLLVESGADTCVSVTEAVDHPWLTFATDDAALLLPYVKPPAEASLRRQDLPPAWVLNGAIYVARTANFIEKPGFLGQRTVAYSMPHARSLDIDTLEDFATVERILASGQSA